MPQDEVEAMVSRARQGVRDYFVERTGFATADDEEGTVSACYGGHWIYLDTEAIARAALSVQPEGERGSEQP